MKLALVLAALLVSSLLAPGTQAATPAAGTLDREHAAVTWSGGPFAVSNPTICAGAQDPTCDHYLLTIELAAGTSVQIAIAGDRSGDDWDLFVFYPDGTAAGSSATTGAQESVVIEHRTDRGAGPYEVRVQPFLVSSGGTYSGVARESDEAVDVERECLEPVPPATALPDGTRIRLSALVLLDGIRKVRGEEVMSTAAASYAPVGIDLTARFRRVSFTGDDAQGLLEQAKALFRGARPEGVDLVYVLTAKDIQAAGNYAVAGLADCIGGVRYPDQAFAVGEEMGEDEAIGPFVTMVDATAKVAAHEIGHLLGAHHHYANCVEGGAGDPPFELSPCTLMFNAVNFASLEFSTLNAAIVRGHAVEYLARRGRAR